jgi:ribosome-binding factor A
MSAHRQEQVSQLIAHLAGDFLERESNRNSLLTVTRADLAPNFKSITIYFSVLPESEEKPALDFAKRQRSAFREYLKKHSRLHPVPNIDFELDYGEKNRQRLDELTRN